MTPETRQRSLRLTAMFAAAAVAIIAAISLLSGSGSSGGNGSSPTPLVKATAASLPACPDPSQAGALHVSGNAVLNSSGKRFTFYGLTVFGGLEDGGNDATWRSAVPAADAQIEAAKYWHANTIRLQIAEENLFNNGNAADGVNVAFLKAVCAQVQKVRRQGMEVVISDQSEWPDWTESNPTLRTEKFWRVIGSVFGNQPGVIFDLYNEPRLFFPKADADYHGDLPKVNPDFVWKTWQHGGNAAGQHFIGMQALVDEVRSTLGLSNVIWLEGPYYDNTLGLAKRYPVTGSGIVWELHHPGLTGDASWNVYFGYLTKNHPVVDGEWSQYASNHPECRPNAYAMVPAYLAYLRAHNIGLLGWSLQPGAMVADPDHLVPTNTTVPRDSRDPRALEHPNKLAQSYSCTNADAGLGIGQLLLDYFKRYSKSAS